MSLPLEPKLEDVVVEKDFLLSSPDKRIVDQSSVSMKHRFNKTKMCIHEINGSCARGPNCSFAHSRSELKVPPNLINTKMCQYVLRGKVCRFKFSSENCLFAHHPSELRVTEGLYKTSMCKFWSTMGSCKLGEFCRYAHGREELRPQSNNESQKKVYPPSPVPVSRVMSLEQKELEKNDIVDSVKKQVHCPPMLEGRVHAYAALQANLDIFKKKVEIFEDGNPETPKASSSFTSGGMSCDALPSQQSACFTPNTSNPSSPLPHGNQGKIYPASSFFLPNQGVNPFLYFRNITEEQLKAVMPDHYED